MFSLSNMITVTVSGIPVQWIPKIELYYPDLPQFPIMYLHSFCGTERVMGFPVAVSYQINGNTCTAEFLVATNAATSLAVQSHLEEEIKERIGISQAITKADVISYCKGNTEYEDFFSELWNDIQASYGASIPYGRFYEEVYSIVRFVAAWNPKTGRQSEMRMLYNFLSTFGEPAVVPTLPHLECYFIPTLDEVENNHLIDFPKFQSLLDSIQKIYSYRNTGQNPVFMTKDYSFEDKAFCFKSRNNTCKRCPNKSKINQCQKPNKQIKTFPVLENAYPDDKEAFISEITLPMKNAQILTDADKINLDGLVDAFNRHPGRACFFITSVMLVKNKICKNWTKDDFSSFYLQNKDLVGYSPKVIACFLQQGFLKDEFIPIDTWVEAFYKYALGIANQTILYDTFDSLGKLERVIWLASQANKTNMKQFYDLLWCQRYGTIGNEILRGINPIACAECALKGKCVGLKQHLNEEIYLTNNLDPANFPTAAQTTHAYVCVLETDIPKKVYVKKWSGRGKNKAVSWELTDEFSGYIMTVPLAPALLQKKIITMQEFVDNYKGISFAK